MEENTLHPARKLLLGQLIAYLLLAVAVVVGFESDLLEVGVCAEDVFVKYQVLMLMEVLTICFIPLALKMLGLSAVRRRLKADRVRGLVLFGSCRCQYHSLLYVDVRGLWLHGYNRRSVLHVCLSQHRPLYQ